MSRLDLDTAAVIVAAPDSECMELRVSADLACELGELARKQGTSLAKVLEAHKCVLVVTDASAVERLASLAHEARLSMPHLRSQLAEDVVFLSPGDRLELEPLDLDELRIQPMLVRQLDEIEPEHYEDRRPRCAKCKRVVSSGRRHCFPCALRR
jgi:hypothetical protein